MAIDVHPASPFVDWTGAQAMSHVLGALVTLGVLLAYFLVSSGRVQSQSYSFQGINVVGASFLVAYSILLSAWAALALNLAWVVIGIVGLARATSQRHRRER